MRGYIEKSQHRKTSVSRLSNSEPIQRSTVVGALICDRDTPRNYLGELPPLHLFGMAVCVRVTGPMPNPTHEGLLRPA